MLPRTGRTTASLARRWRVQHGKSAWNRPLCAHSNTPAARAPCPVNPPPRDPSRANVNPSPSRGVDARQRWAKIVQSEVQQSRQRTQRKWLSLNVLYNLAQGSGRDPRPVDPQSVRNPPCLPTILHRSNPNGRRSGTSIRPFELPRCREGEKLYVLDMFPYPSGDGLHVGHPEGYTATDIVCRFARMRGKSVLHPMGFDAFGLPAEEHAIRTNTPPRESTERNIATFRRQLKMLGFSYDWQRQLATTDVDYFRWTQWIFLVLFDTWFDPQQSKGRPIAELPIPDEIAAGGRDRGAAIPGRTSAGLPGRCAW